MTPAQRSQWICQKGLAAGFDRIGIAPAAPVPRANYIDEWLSRGRAGEMTYLHRHRDLLSDPRQLLPDARSMIVVAHNYSHGTTQPDAAAGRHVTSSCDRNREPTGRIAQYAWGRDYHRVLRRKLQRFADQLHDAISITFESRVCVDTAPIVEREAAVAAGIGWIGKNTMLLTTGLGSFFFLGEILTTLPLEPSSPVTDHCGACTRCIDACPTGALVAPYQMDASRCISYLTIEHRSHIDSELQPLMKDWVFGCDICQEVCPHNRRTPRTAEPAYERLDRNPLPPRPVLRQIHEWTDEQYRECLAGSAMKRATLAMLKRNAEIAARNLNDQKTSETTG